MGNRSPKTGQEDSPKRPEARPPAGSPETRTKPCTPERIDSVVRREMAHSDAALPSGLHHAGEIGHRSEIHVRLESAFGCLDSKESKEDR